MCIPTSLTPIHWLLFFAAGKRVAGWLLSALVVLALSAPATTAAASPRVTAQPAHTVVELGLPLTYTITVEIPDTGEIQETVPDKRIGDWTVRSVRRRHRAGRQTRIYQYELELVTFATGEVEISAFDVPYRDKTAANGQWQTVPVPAQMITVTGLVAEDEQPALKAEKPHLRRWPWLVAALLALLAGAIAAGWWLIRRRAPRPIAVAPVPAHVRAFAALEELRARQLPAQGRMEEYFVCLSDIARHYLEQRFGVHAPSMSSEEFLIAAGNADFLAPEHHTMVREFLQIADLVKFACYGCSLPEAEEAYACCRRLIEQTLPQPAKE